MALCLRLTVRDYGAFQMSVLEMKNEGVDKSLTRIEPAYGLFIL